MLKSLPHQILLVCYGNTCRSPLAQVFLQIRLRQHPQLPNITVTSAGTSAAWGRPVSEGAYLVGLERGLDLSQQASRPVTVNLLAESDLILAMSAHQLEQLRSMGAADRSTTLLEFAGAGGGDVIDPIGGTLADYRMVADILDQAMAGVVQKLLILAS